MKRLGPEGGVLAHRLFLEGGSFVNINPASFSWLKPPPLAAALPAGRGLWDGATRRSFTLGR